jgi:hypothetical protein
LENGKKIWRVFQLIPMESLVVIHEILEHHFFVVDTTTDPNKKLFEVV